MLSMRIESIDVFLDSFEAVVCCRRGCEYVSADMATRLTELFPHLGEQVCVNAGHGHFGDEIEGTELPHLLEHVTIELLVGEARMYMPDEEHVFMGNTSWRKGSEHSDEEHEGERVMKVCITFENDLVALGALKQAAAIIEWSRTGKLPSPDVEHILQELHGVRMD